MRLVMPPALGMILSIPIWTLYSLLLPTGFGDAVVAGSYLGFVLYDLIHCKFFYFLFRCVSAFLLAPAVTQGTSYAHK
jgi:hypothetical protein